MRKSCNKTFPLPTLDAPKGQGSQSTLRHARNIKQAISINLHTLNSLPPFSSFFQKIFVLSTQKRKMESFSQFFLNYCCLVESWLVALLVLLVCCLVDPSVREGGGVDWSFGCWAAVAWFGIEGRDGCCCVVLFYWVGCLWGEGWWLSERGRGRFVVWLLSCCCLVVAVLRCVV